MIAAMPKYLFDIKTCACHARCKREGKGHEMDRHEGEKEKAKLFRLPWNQFIAYFLLSHSVFCTLYQKMRQHLTTYHVRSYPYSIGYDWNVNVYLLNFTDSHIHMGVYVLRYSIHKLTKNQSTTNLQQYLGHNNTAQEWQYSMTVTTTATTTVTMPLPRETKSTELKVYHSLYLQFILCVSTSLLLFSFLFQRKTDNNGNKRAQHNAYSFSHDVKSLCEFSQIDILLLYVYVYEVVGANICIL